MSSIYSNSNRHIVNFLLLLPNLSTLSVPDEGYYVPDEGYSRNASCALNLISTFLLHHVSIDEMSPSFCSEPIKKT